MPSDCASARAHHRSLQGELMAVLERVVEAERPLRAEEVLEQVREAGLSTPPESAEIVRRLRDSG